MSREHAGFRLAERRRSRTDRAVGYTTALVLKTSMGTKTRFAKATGLASARRGFIARCAAGAGSPAVRVNLARRWAVCGLNQCRLSTSRGLRPAPTSSLRKQASGGVVYRSGTAAKPVSAASGTVLCARMAEGRRRQVK